MYRKIFFEHTFPLVTPSHSPASSTLLIGSSIPMSLIDISPHHIPNLTDQALSVICSSNFAHHGTPLSRKRRAAMTASHSLPSRTSGMNLWDYTRTRIHFPQHSPPPPPTTTRIF